MAMECKTKTFKYGARKRCVCNGKIAKNSRCGLGYSKKPSRKKKSKAAYCVPKTARYLKGGACACRTQGGGFSIISKSACKRKYAKKK